MAEFKFSDEAERTGLMLPGELAALFGVDHQTVTRWRLCGKLGELGGDVIRTPGGRYRYALAKVRAILNGGRP